MASGNSAYQKFDAEAGRFNPGYYGYETKKAQVTIFIILAIVLVIGIILIFTLRKTPQIEKPSAIGNPKAFIQSCVRDSVEESVQVVLENGGRTEPTQYISYQDEKYNYLCYQGDYYLGCYNTHPMLELIVEKEILENTKPGVKKCFDDLEAEYEAKGYAISIGTAKYSIDLVPGAVQINLKDKVEISKEGSSQTFEDFSTEFTSAIYDLIRISREIVNSESQYCNVEYNGYMILYPEYDLKRFDYEGSKLYWVKERRSGEEFKFAVRSCAFAPGI